MCCDTPPPPLPGHCARDIIKLMATNSLSRVCLCYSKQAVPLPRYDKRWTTPPPPPLTPPPPSDVSPSPSLVRVFRGKWFHGTVHLLYV